MKKALQSILVLGLMLTFGVGSTFAADQTRKRAPKKDGTCRSMISPTDDSYNLAAQKNQIRKRTRSCQSAMSAGDDSFSLAADRKKSRDRSCRSDISTTVESLNLAAQKSQLRKRLRTC